MSDAAIDNNSNSGETFLSGKRIKTVLILAGPVLATMLSVNLMSLIDTLMIGQLGDAALAGVSVAGNLFFMVFSLVMGISAGVQIIVARRMGEGEGTSALTILNAGILIAGIGGLVMAVIAYALLPLLTGLLNDDPQVVINARAYLSTVFPSLFIGGMSTAFAGYWMGVQRPIFNLITIAIQLFCNAFFNWLFIFGNLGAPRLEIAGAGLGTTLANLVALLVNVVIVLIVVENGVFLRRLPEKERIKNLLLFSLPMGLQQFLFAAGMLVFVAIVGLLGTKQLAAFQIVMVIMMTSLMLAIGLGTISTSLVGSALGRKNVADASQWGWEVAALGAGTLLVLGIVLLLAAEQLLQAFTKEQSTAEMALLPLRIMIISIWLEAFGRILSMALVGAGAVGTVFKITFFNQWFLRLPLYWVVGVYLEQGLVGIFLVMLVLYVLQTSLFVRIWSKKGWAETKA